MRVARYKCLVGTASVAGRGTVERAERLDHPFAVSVTGRGQGRSLAFRPFIRLKRCEAGFQGLQAHEEKIQRQRTPHWLRPPSVFVCRGFLFCLVSFCLVSFGLVWTRIGIE